MGAKLPPARSTKAAAGSPSWPGLPVVLGVLAAAAAAAHAGWLKLELPYPGIKQYAELVPPDVYPWRPAPIDRGLFEIKQRLRATRLFEGVVIGSESVTVAPDGRFIMLDRYSAVWAASQAPDGSMQLEPRPLAHLGPGRPLGAAFDAAGDLIICDAFKGLIKLNLATRQVELLTNHVSADSPLAPGSPLVYTNDLDIAADGTVYFTDSTDFSPHRNAQHDNDVNIFTIAGRPGYYDTQKGWGLGMLQGLPRGRFLAYYPSNRTTHVLAEGFYYPNGVALSPDGSFAAVGETDRLRVLKVFLPPHPRAGQHEVLIDHLPGTPDGVHASSDGHFWVSLLASVPGFTRHFGSPLVRGLLGQVPENWRPKVPTWGAVLKLSTDGRLLRWLVDLKGETASRISSAHEHQGRLYLGNLSGEYVSYVELDGDDEAAAAAAAGDDGSAQQQQQPHGRPAADAAAAAAAVTAGQQQQ